LNAERTKDANPLILNFDFDAVSGINRNEFITFLDSYTADFNIAGGNLSTFRYENLPINLFATSKLQTPKTANAAPGKPSKFFAQTGQFSKLIEQILSSILFDQIPLLVGETGCGKTTCIQEIAKIFKKELHVYNLSQSSDVNDLLGGFRPLNLSTYLEKIYSKFYKILITVSGPNLDNNKPFIANLTNLITQKKYLQYIKCLVIGLEALTKKIQGDTSLDGQKLLDKCLRMHSTLKGLLKLKNKLESQLIFSYMKGNLIEALKNGNWVLLDEINLAEAEVLQKLMPIFEGESLILVERGKIEEVPKHKDFRIFACMNPGNDVARKELPDNINNKFIEIYVRELEKAEELIHIVEKLCLGNINSESVDRIVRLYLRIRNLCSQNLLQDGFGRTPQFSLRTLARACHMLTNGIRLYGNSGPAKLRS
jgi:midasin